MRPEQGPIAGAFSWELSGQLDKDTIMQGRAPQSCGDRRQLPRPERSASKAAKRWSGDQMRLSIEGVVDGCVCGEKSLG
jgi:hypothetical protein